MAEHKTTTEKEISTKIEKLSAKTERIGWIFFVLLIGIAILGFTGKGPFNNVLTQSENSSVKYDRVTRKFSPSRLEIETSANTRILSLPKKILSFYTIQSILPPPKNVYEDKNTIIYSFSSTIPSVTFNLSSEKSGYINEFIKVGNEKLKIQQIILP